ncbi:hypothetical protein AMIS_74100 [Actinoplanes missouriensis 431]|uniref:Uncharacterized protein n=1 Tax=Actinoplanes missouriensis (strain ATCC 14538 / DSM 43046 / CBS 188.64 / JCM 3121 / NBRC 102363 / NCIMB 12654 / NRRL B-3342 / UNCC 431) TaxID=512565 RepID=I0HHZ3_ACTM4|nr:hypothetical protein [Actinoplanes missouriensis]BAL92630.1 hypothetical protein AMIS_74100 [Actinoplanes missouriensis 431]
MAEVRPLWERIPHRPSAEEIEQADRIQQVHADWVREHADEMPFDSEGRRAGSDYPLHYVDVEASGEALDDLKWQIGPA